MICFFGVFNTPSKFYPKMDPEQMERNGRIIFDMTQQWTVRLLSSRYQVCPEQCCESMVRFLFLQTIFQGLLPSFTLEHHITHCKSYRKQHFLRLKNMKSISSPLNLHRWIFPRNFLPQVAAIGPRPLPVAPRCATNGLTRMTVYMYICRYAASVMYAEKHTYLCTYT